jgi:mono/diheme cytochrome c family protein
MKPFLPFLLLVTLTGSVLAAEPAPVASYAICSACHAPDGKGLNAGTPMPMAPSLSGSKLATAGDGEVLAAIILNGIQKEDTKYLGVMAPLGAMFTDDQFAEVITYVRSAFGNTASAVTVDQAKAWREKYNGKPMWTRAKLDELMKEALAE